MLNSYEWLFMVVEITKLYLNIRMYSHVQSTAICKLAKIPRNF